MGIGSVISWQIRSRRCLAVLRLRCGFFFFFFFFFFFRLCLEIDSASARLRILDTLFICDDGGCGLRDQLIEAAGQVADANDAMATPYSEQRADAIEIVRYDESRC
jgi:hypothetical protein